MTSPTGRLLTLLSLLQSRRDWPCETLADRLEVSPRTVRRDVDRLRRLGYPVQTAHGPGAGYRLGAGTELPPLLFDEEQAVAVAIALQTAATGISGVAEAALRALATVRQVMPSRLRRRVDALELTALASGWTPPEVSIEQLVLVGTAVRDREVLRFDYTARDGRKSTRRVEPHRLVSWGRRWYVVSYDLDRADWRCFRVDRLAPKTPSGPRFRPRELTDEQVEQLLHPRAEEPAWAVRGTALMHAPAAEVARWLPAYQGTVTARDERSCLVEMGSWSHAALVGWLLLFDSDFEVINPPELAQAVAATRERLDRALAVAPSRRQARSGEAR